MRVLLVDDHGIVRAGIRRVLAESFADVEFGEATSASEALHAVRAQEWDLVLLDISLPGRTGLDALPELRGLAPRVPVLVMTMYGEEQYALRAFRGGAAGYLTKASDPEELLEAVRKVLAGGRYVSRAVAEQLAGSLIADADRPPHERLSHREFQVLQLLATGVSVKGIAHALHLSDKTVSTYRSRVLEKLQLRSTAELMRYAHRANLVD